MLGLWEGQSGVGSPEGFAYDGQSLSAGILVIIITPPVVISCRAGVRGQALVQALLACSLSSSGWEEAHSPTQASRHFLSVHGVDCALDPRDQPGHTLLFWSQYWKGRRPAQTDECRVPRGGPWGGPCWVGVLFLWVARGGFSGR